MVLVPTLTTAYGCYVCVQKEKSKTLRMRLLGGVSVSMPTDAASITPAQAWLLPIAGSVVLILLFFFKDIMIFLTLYVLLLATISVPFVLEPVYRVSPTYGHVLVSLLSVAMIVLWLWTSHWAVCSLLALSMAVLAMVILRITNGWAIVILFCGLFFYDIFWVFLSPYVFHSNVMVTVAQQEANNPMYHIMAFVEHMGVPLPQWMLPTKILSLPLKIMLPVGMKDDGSVHYSMLGLGDIIVPAFLAIYVCRNAVGNYLPPLRAPLVCFFVGYVAGLASASIAVAVFHYPQPALLYLVPMTTIPVLLAFYREKSLLPFLKGHTASTDDDADLGDLAGEQPGVPLNTHQDAGSYSNAPIDAEAGNPRHSSNECDSIRTDSGNGIGTLNHNHTQAERRERQSASPLRDNGTTSASRELVERRPFANGGSNPPPSASTSNGVQRLPMASQEGPRKADSSYGVLGVGVGVGAAMGS
uniref:Uncharacterized protein n=1 Tax=Vitrella brassicaformis TaxID=1169539 RepID=A0A7S1K203_9ALVE